jgi:hypothetical protein
MYDIDKLTSMLNINSQCDVKNIMTLPMKTSVLKLSTYIIAVTAARPIGLAVMLIMSVSTSKIAKVECTSPENIQAMVVTLMTAKFMTVAQCRQMR